MRREREDAELATFNAAATELTGEDRDDREDILAAFSNRNAAT